MNYKKGASALFITGVILFVAAFAADIILDLAAGKNVFIEVTDRIICILFGGFFGFYLCKRKTKSKYTGCTFSRQGREDCWLELKQPLP